MNPRSIIFTLPLVLGAFASGALAVEDAKQTAQPAAEVKPVLPIDATEITSQQVDAYLAMIHAGDANTVIKELEKHPLLKATNRRVEVVYGTALYFAGRVREAANLAIKYKSATQTDPVALRFAGYAFLGTNDFEAAEKFFRLAQSQAKDDVEARFNVARCHALLKPDEASLAAVKAFEPDAGKLPKDQFDTVVCDLTLRIARQRVLEGKRGPDTIALLEDAAKRRPKDVEPEELIASIYVEAGDYDKARDLLAAMERKFDDKLERVMFLKARMYEKQGDWKQARTAANDAVTLSNWTHLPSLLLAARAAMQLGDYDSARRPLDKALVVAPGDYDTRIAMASYLLHRARESKVAAERGEYMTQCEKNCFQAVAANSLDPRVFELLVELYTLWGDAKKTELGASQSDLERTRLIEKAKRAKSAPK